MNETLDRILNAGLAAYTTRTNSGTVRAQAQAQTAQAQAQTAESKKWVPFAIIGGAVALVLVLIFAFRK